VIKMTKKNQAKFLGLIILGFGLGIGYVLADNLVVPKLLPRTTAQIEERKIRDYKEVESVCGENNVSELCSDGTNGCKVITGFACNNYKNAVHKEEIEKERKEREEQYRREFPEYYK